MNLLRSLDDLNKQCLQGVRCKYPFQDAEQKSTAPHLIEDLTQLSELELFLWDDTWTDREQGDGADTRTANYHATDEIYGRDYRINPTLWSAPEEDDEGQDQERNGGDERPNNFRRKLYQTFVNFVGLSAKGTAVCLSFCYRPYLFIELRRELQENASHRSPGRS